MERIGRLWLERMYRSRSIERLSGPRVDEEETAAGWFLLRLVDTGGGGAQRAKCTRSCGGLRNLRFAQRQLRESEWQTSVQTLRIRKDSQSLGRVLRDRRLEMEVCHPCAAGQQRHSLLGRNMPTRSGLKTRLKRRDKRVFAARQEDQYGS